MSERPALRRVLLPLLALLALPQVGAAQNITDELARSRRRLDSIRVEREQLREQQQRLQSQVKDLGAEIRNIERQQQTTNRIVNELETQIAGLNTQLDRISAELVLAQDNLAGKRAVLQRRLVEIYKRGPLYTFQALLAAESFGDLVRRYKYLYLSSRQDRVLVSEVEHLRDRVGRQRSELLGFRTALDRSLGERESELDRYANLVESREGRLRDLRRSGRSTEERLTALERDEARLNEVLASLERARRAAASREGRPAGGAAAPAGSMTTADLGNLDWPVEGQIIYGFGRVALPSGAVVRRNGIGIRSQEGAPIKAVESGRVAMVQPLSTDGLTVILEHGDGYYSIYKQLLAATVQRDATVARGQVIGTVGGSNSDEGPHLGFEIRGEKGIALDPTDWLRKRR